MDKLVPQHLNDPILFIEWSRAASARRIQLLFLLHDAFNKVLIIWIVSLLTWTDPDNEISSYQKTLREFLERLTCPSSMINFSIWSLQLDPYKGSFWDSTSSSRWICRRKAASWQQFHARFTATKYPASLQTIILHRCALAATVVVLPGPFISAVGCNKVVVNSVFGHIHVNVRCGRI